MDVIRPLPCSSGGQRYILAFVDYATHYPDAVSLRAVMASRISEQLVKWIARMGVPHEILMDQGHNFMLGVLQGVCQTLRIKQLHMSVYRPQRNGLVERLNGSIKKMLDRCIQGDLRKWDLLLPLVLFVLKDTPSESLKYSPFELILGTHPRGLLQILREDWECSSTAAQDPTAYWQAFQR